MDATGSRFAGFEGETRQILSSVAPDSWKTMRNDVSPGGGVGGIVSSPGLRTSIDGAGVCSLGSPPPQVENRSTTANTAVQTPAIRKDASSLARPPRTLFRTVVIGVGRRAGGAASSPFG